MLRGFFQWLYMRKVRRGSVAAAGDYRPARLPYERAFVMPRFGKYETFPRLKRFLLGCALVAGAVFAVWFIFQSAGAFALFD